MNILSGIVVRDVLRQQLMDHIGTLKTKPELVIIQIGDNPESSIYIEQKKKFGQSVGIPVHHVVLPVTITEQEVIDTIHTYNANDNIKGIIVQLPIPSGINTKKILDEISPEKDVDGLGAYSHYIPATARGIMSLCDYYDIGMQGKHVVVVGRSELVGKPTALLCLKRNATVTVCHSYTKNLKEITKQADILIVACGKLQYITSEFVSAGQVVIDVGIHRTEHGLCGDVDMESVKHIVGSITPVPGGVGPLTVVSLFQNVCDIM